jgi:hypothetical protein
MKFIQSHALMFNKRVDDWAAIRTGRMFDRVGLLDSQAMRLGSMA